MAKVKAPMANNNALEVRVRITPLANTSRSRTNLHALVLRPPSELRGGDAKCHMCGKWPRAAAGCGYTCSVCGLFPSSPPRGFGRAPLPEMDTGFPDWDVL